MRRTNLVLDEDLLESAVQATGQKTYSGAVNHALREVVRLHQARGLLALVGTGVWEGDLAEQREDRDPSVRRKRRR